MEPFKVSILIPLYNSEDWISETIGSIQNQSYKNIELIIVDDGSTDRSYDIASSYVNDSRISVFQQKNLGACAARNLAFEKSIGDYIVFFDSDDLMYDQKIENQVKLAVIHGDKFIYSSQWIAFKGPFSFDIVPVKSKIDKDFDNPVDWLVTSWMNKSGAVGIWMTPRSIIQKAGKWDESLRVNQDGEFFFRVLMNCTGVKFSDESYMFYRRNVTGSISKLDTEAKIADRLKSYIMYEKILNVKDDSSVKCSLVRNYAKLIYLYPKADEELIDKAWERIQELGGFKHADVGGRFFQLASKFVGFKKALLIKKIISK